MHEKTDLSKLNQLSYKVISAAIEVHKETGPGLLESTYETCLEYELLKMNMKVERQKNLPVFYKKIKMDRAYQIDLLVEDCLLIELKSVDTIAPVHKAQVLTYLKLSGLKLGLLLNFNVPKMKDGINRIIL